MFDIYRDREKSVISGWPEGYSSAVVEAVRLIEAEGKAAEAAVWEQVG